MMNIIKIITLTISILIPFACKKDKIKSFIRYNPIIEQDSTKVFPKDWLLYDIEQDTIPGISYNRAYKELLQNKKGKEVIVAVIDTEMDIESPVIKPHLWVNEDEIANNGLDDDKNGYIDDTNGWNFLGLPNGESLLYDSYDYVRILQKKDSLKPVSNEWHSITKKAEKWVNQKSKDIEYQIEYGNELKNLYLDFKKEVQSIAPNMVLTKKLIDSLASTEDKTSSFREKCELFSYFYSFKKVDHSYFMDYSNKYENFLKYSNNIKYNPGKKRNLGNSNLSNNINIYSHATRVAGLILNLNKKVKILPIITCLNNGFGSENDLDIANGIRYAADNGAKIINMSFWKHTYTNFQKIKEAILYAQSKNVLLVGISGNDGHEIFTKYETQSFPNDTDLNSINEFTDNLIKVGSNNYFLDKRINSEFSNYSKVHVDFFTPGENIETLRPGSYYEKDRGTSLSAAIVSGMAANLFSYFPELTAAEVKQILMDSGVQYDILVDIPGEKEGETKQVPFSELSKSGKIANMYNAVLMAEEVVKNKK